MSYDRRAGAHELEPATPILGLCHGVFTDRFIFRSLFAGNFFRSLPVLSNVIHRSGGKKMAAKCAQSFDVVP